MKLLIRLISLCLILYAIGQSALVCSASSYKDFQTNKVSEDEANSFLQKISFSVSNTERTGSAFSSFAVSEEGKIALCINGDSAAINVYNSDGTFLYGFHFQNGYSSLAVFFEGETLSIIWGKNGYIGSFAPDGKCINFEKDAQTQNNAHAYQKHRYRPTSGSAGDKQYTVERIGLSPDYTQFCLEDISGNKTVIYKAERESYTSLITTCVFVIIPSLFILYAVRQQKNEDKKM